MKLLLALAAGFVGFCYYTGSKSRAGRTALKEDLRRWEAEGGNVPAVATPSPAAYPPPDATVRH